MESTEKYKNILEFCIEFITLTFHEKFAHGHYKSSGGNYEHEIDYLSVKDCPTVSRVAQKSKIVQVNDDIKNFSYTSRLFLLLFSFVILDCDRDTERADLSAIMLMNTVWEKLKLSRKDLCDDMFIFMANNPSRLNERRIKNMIDFLIVQENNRKNL